MRPSIDEYFTRMAALVSTRGTCARRKVGCVLVDARRHVLATGYNGVASGLPHCEELPCHSTAGQDLCEAIHAEQNAMLQCRDVHAILTAYVTLSPCRSCVKLLLNTSCQRIVFFEFSQYTEALQMWERAGRIWALGSLGKSPWPGGSEGQAAPPPDATTEPGSRAGLVLEPGLALLREVR